MGREQQVATRLEPAGAHRVHVITRRARAAQGHVDHHVADEHDPARDRLGAQVLGRGLRGAQQQRADPVGEHAVELLGHRAVVRAHARLDVHERYRGLSGRERARQRGVGVAVDEHGVGAQLLEYRPQGGEHARGLGRVRAAAQAELAVRARETQLGKEDARQRVVVVLASVHQDLLVLFAKQPGNGRGLDELGSVADDGDDLHWLSLCGAGADNPAPPRRYWSRRC